MSQRQELNSKAPASAATLISLNCQGFPKFKMVSTLKLLRIDDNLYGIGQKVLSSTLVIAPIR